MARLEDLAICPTCGTLAEPVAHKAWHGKLAKILKAIIAKADPTGLGWMP